MSGIVWSEFCITFVSRERFQERAPDYIVIKVIFI